MCSRALRASCLTCPSASRTSFPICSRALRASCPTCSRALRATWRTCSCVLRISCLSCSRASPASYPTCLVPYMLSCLMFLVPYVPFALRAWCQTRSRVSRVLLVLVPHVFCALHIFGLRQTLRALLFIHPSLASGISSLTCSYASHVL